jgi:hypothetical protein
MVISKSPSERSPTMTSTKDKPATAAIKELLSQNPDGLREIVRAVMQEMLEAEMTDTLQAEKGERTAARLGYRSGYYSRTLVTRSASSSCGCRRTGTGAFPPSCSSAISAPSRRWLPRWLRVRPGRLHPHGQGHHRRVVRPQLLGLGDLLDQQAPGLEPCSVRRTKAGGAIPVPDPRCPL